MLQLKNLMSPPAFLRKQEGGGISKVIKNRNVLDFAKDLCVPQRGRTDLSERIGRGINMPRKSRQKPINMLYYYLFNFKRSKRTIE